MKNRRLLSVSAVIAVMVLMFETLAINVSALTDEVYFLEKMYDFEGAGDINDIGEESYFFAINGLQFSEKYYYQLDTDSKTVYDALATEYASAPHGNRVKINISKTWANRTITRQNGSVSLDTATENEIKQWIRDTVTPAVFALIYDHPELSWLINTSYASGYNSAGFSFPYGVNTIVSDVKVNTLIFQLTAVYTDTGDIDDVTAAVSQAKTVIDAKNNENDGLYGTLKCIHDYVCSMASYATTNFNSRSYQTPYSVFYGDHTTVCAGYAKAFKILCEAYNIPCILVSGSSVQSGTAVNHMWNYVMLGSRWYAVDTTWDDQSITRYDFFLVGASTVDTHFEKETFGYNHRPSGAWTTTAAYVFLYPSLSDTAYVHSFGDWEYTSDSIHTRTCLSCGKKETGTHTFTSAVTTAATYTSEGVRTYTCNVCNGTKTETIPMKTVIAGDVTLDGRITSKDISDFKKYLAGKLTLDSTQLIAANVNGDRRINSLDVIALKYKLAGR